MKIVIQKRRKHFNKRSYFYEYNSFEIVDFRWEKNHQFKYVALGSSVWSELEKAEELVGLSL